MIPNIVIVLCDFIFVSNLRNSLQNCLSHSPDPSTHTNYSCSETDGLLVMAASNSFLSA